VEPPGPFQRLQPAREAEAPLPEGRSQSAEEFAPGYATEDADRQEEVVAAGDPAALVGREPAAGDDAMDVRVQRAAARMSRP
jgi:hypothetical protein